jgi:poly(hydroxyalkanoate) depolymerase family esterase
MARRRSSGVRGPLPGWPYLPALPKRATPKRATPKRAAPKRAAPPRARRGRAARSERAPAGRPAGGGRWVRGLHVGPHGARSFDLYLPAGLRRRTRAPLVVLLHGCGQTSAEFADATRFVAAADRNGFVVVAPHQEGRHHPHGCWRWYEAANQRRGTGEPAVLVGVVRQVVAESVRWRIDPRRVYVAGLSAGGAMALTLAATYPDVVAAAGVHSAPAYRSATTASRALSAMAGRTVASPPLPGAVAPMAPTIVVQGTADHVVRPSNGDRVTDQWLAYRAAAAVGTSTDGRVGRVGRVRTTNGRTRDGRGHTTTRWYTTRGRKVLEYWLVDGLGHAWSGGRDGSSYSDPAGPRAATLMWRFFRGHTLGRRS